MNEIEQLTKQLLELTGTSFVFPEYYSHTSCDMWKIKNPYTKYKEEKLVLCSVEDENGLQKALVIALSQIAMKKEAFEKG